MQKILTLTIMLLLNACMCTQEISALHTHEQTEAPTPKNQENVYLHGWAEGTKGNNQGPALPDSDARFWRACFYTKPAVHVAANYIKRKIDDGADAINLMGKSCGGGIILTLLAKLIDYEKDPDYFNGTEIKSKEDAQKVLDAINNGSVHLSIPLLNLKHTNIPKGIEWLLYTGAAFLATKYVIIDNSGTLVTALATLAIAGPLSIVINSISKVTTGQSVQDGLFSFAEQKIIPLTGNFDPNHIKPIDAAKIIEGKLKCPILIHYCETDGLLAHQEEDIAKVAQSLKVNNDKVHVVVSPAYKGFHYVVISNEYRQAEKEFKKEYGISG